MIVVVLKKLNKRNQLKSGTLNKVKRFKAVLVRSKEKTSSYHNTVNISIVRLFDSQIFNILDSVLLTKVDSFPVGPLQISYRPFYQGYDQ